MNRQIHKKEPTSYDYAKHHMGHDDFDYYAWPQTFGSTSGPRGGMGGQAITTMTVEAFVTGRRAILICGGMYFITDEFKMGMKFPMRNEGSKSIY